MPQPTPIRVLHTAAAAMFAVFSWLQWNDLDPAIYDRPSLTDAIFWGLFYALIAVLFIVALFRRLPGWLLITAAACCLVQLARTAPGFWENLTGEHGFTMTQGSMSAADPRVELTREFFGAMIALAGVAFLAWKERFFGTSQK